MGQQVIVNPVTRIEGHARVVLDLDEKGEIQEGHLQVLELRGFEKLLEGTELFKMPQITARLCGVCPAAHHLVSVIAIENGLGIDVPPEAKLLRELLYAGHILHSHALSTLVLMGPDLLLGVDAPPATRNVFSLLRTDPDLAKKALRLRSIGQRTVEIVGGRGVHPVTAVPGGMAGRPKPEALELIAGWGDEAQHLLAEITARLDERLANLADLRDSTYLPYNSVALSENGTHTLLSGTCLSVRPDGTVGRTFAAADYGKHLVEHVVPGSYMKNVRLRGDGSGDEKPYFVGPLARLNVNHTFTTPQANAALKQFRATFPRLSALDYVPARLIEMVHCAERMQQIAGGEIAGGPIRVPAHPAGARCIGLIEAPRGILIHDYLADDNGRVAEANLIVATQNNYDGMDYAITSMARHLAAAKDDNLLMNGIEFAVRCFDPCLACATHAAGRMPLEVTFRHGGTVVRRLSRKAAS